VNLGGFDALIATGPTGFLERRFIQWWWDFPRSDVPCLIWSVHRSSSIWPHLSYGLVRSKREYCH